MNKLYSTVKISDELANDLKSLESRHRGLGYERAKKHLKEIGYKNPDKVELVDYCTFYRLQFEHDNG